MPKTLLSLRKIAIYGMTLATSLHKMTRIQAICPISTRPVYIGARPIAPAGETRWSPDSDEQPESLQPEVQVLRTIPRPAQKPNPNRTAQYSIHVSAFVTQVIAQHDREIVPAAGRCASSSYEKADALDRTRANWFSRAI